MRSRDTFPVFWSEGKKHTPVCAPISQDGKTPKDMKREQGLVCGTSEQKKSFVFRLPSTVGMEVTMKMSMVTISFNFWFWGNKQS